MPARDKTAMATTLLNLTENAALRGMLVEAEGVDEKDKWWFSVYDFINFVCEKDPKGTYAHVTFYVSQKMAMSIKNQYLQIVSIANSPVNDKKTHPASTAVSSRRPSRTYTCLSFSYLRTDIL
jgi:hypothetical protein